MKRKPVYVETTIHAPLEKYGNIRKIQSFMNSGICAFQPFH